ncbi:hypothetical protein BGZ76_002567, partial [Entomortierella beljakovae]
MSLNSKTPLPKLFEIIDERIEEESKNSQIQLSVNQEKEDANRRLCGIAEISFKAIIDVNVRRLSHYAQARMLKEMEDSFLYESQVVNTSEVVKSVVNDLGRFGADWTKSQAIEVSLLSMINETNGQKDLCGYKVDWVSEQWFNRGCCDEIADTGDAGVLYSTKFSHKRGDPSPNQASSLVSETMELAYVQVSTEARSHPSPDHTAKIKSTWEGSPETADARAQANLVAIAKAAAPFLAAKPHMKDRLMDWFEALRSTDSSTDPI